MADEPDKLKGLNIDVGASARYERKVDVKVTEPEDVNACEGR